MSSDAGRPVAISVRDVVKRYAVRGPGSPTSLRESLSALARRRPPADVFAALDGVSLEIEAGGIVGIIGSNGAGKSTLLKVLTRITGIDEGAIDIAGRVGSLLEVGTGFHPDLTGRENVALSGSLLGMSQRRTAELFDEIVAFAGVERAIDTPVKRYSSGMAVRLAFAVAAHLDAEVLLIDEVLAVGDASFQVRCVEKIEALAADEGRTILFVSHNMAPVRRMCERVVVMEEGRVAFDGAPEAALERYLALGGTDAGSGWTDLRRRANPHPSHAVHLVGVGLRRTEGGPWTSTLQAESPFQLVLDVEGLGDVDGPSVGVRVGTGLDTSLCTFTTHRAPLPPEADGRLRVVLDVAGLPFIGGRYWVDVSLASLQRGTIVDEVARAATFELVRPGIDPALERLTTGDGVVVVEAAWSHEPLERGG